VNQRTPAAWAAIAMMIAAVGGLSAAGAAPDVAPAAPAPSAAPATPVPDDTVTSHGSVTIGGTPIAYAARAGTIPLIDAAGHETARVFSVSYIADALTPRTRPVTFVWNGGPGSSSMWLHMGSFAPVRVAVPSDAKQPAPGTPLGPNPDSLIDVTDLVFIDAVGTGYSRITGKGTPAMFFGVDQDAAAFAQFIRAWLTRNDRWGSPVFLLGESYGTTRAANVVNLLQNQGLAVSGVTLVSSVLDYNALDNDQQQGEDYPYISFLPTEAAVAWYHHAAPGAPAELATVVADARAFAQGEYASALMRGDDLDAATRRDVVSKLHALTGLDEGYIRRADLRIDPSRFEHALLGGEGITTGRLDGRYQGPQLDRTADAERYDPTSDDALTDAFTTAFNRYSRDVLGYRTDRPYYGTNYELVGEHWNYRRMHSISAPNVAGDLREALLKNPFLHVFSANGYFDLATPFFGTEYTLGHLNLPPAARARIQYGFYPSGHMIYLNDASRAALKADLASFYRSAMARER
jgi:carboxypeptidase C (cathepsin A)